MDIHDIQELMKKDQELMDEEWKRKMEKEL
jgi:hypothetical protein